MSNLTKILIFLGVALTAVTIDEATTKTETSRHRYNGHYYDSSGDASIVLDGEIYNTTMGDKDFAPLNTNWVYTFKSKDPTFSSVRYTGVDPSTGTRLK